MKIKIILASILVSLSVSKSQANIVCLAPEPVYCGLTLIAMGVIAAVGSSKEEVKLDKINLTDKQELIDALTVKLMNNDKLNSSLSYHKKRSPSFKSIVRRFENNKITGNLSLTSLYEFTPRMFNELDKFKFLIVDTLKENLTESDHENTTEMANLIVAKVYGKNRNQDGGINWSYYAMLANDANNILLNKWNIRAKSN